jgi:hypothetical protein
MDYEVKTVKKTLPPRLFFLGGAVDGFLPRVFCWVIRGFCLVLYVELRGFVGLLM